MNFDGFLNGDFLDSIFSKIVSNDTLHREKYIVYSDIFKSKVCLSKISYNNKRLIIGYVIIQIFYLRS